MKALVTGGAGFIGSHLVEALVRQGAAVEVLDNLSTGSLANLAWRASGNAIEFVQGDVHDEALVRKLLPGCDVVFHEAALVSVPLSVEKPLESHRDNLTSTLQLLAAAREAGVRRFVFASSCAVYGDNAAPRKHEQLAVAPQTPYALQKYAAERYCQLFHALYGLPTVCLRYFNVFGPRQSSNSPYSGVIARFCTALLAGDAPTIFGDGHQSRDFVYVANVVKANLLAAERPAEQVAGKVFNIGSGRSVTILELVEELARQLGQKVTPRFEPARPGDVRCSEADITLAQRVLGYSAEVDWQRGLERTLAFYQRASASATR